MAITKKMIRDAWERVVTEDLVELGSGSGVFLQTGRSLIEDSTPEEVEEFGLDAETIYITTDDAQEPTPVYDVEYAIDELKYQIRDVEPRYVVLDTKASGDQYETVLPADATEADGIEELDKEWAYLTEHDRKGRTLELVRMACLLEDGEVSTAIDEDEDRDYIESMGWDWFGSYSPIATREV